MSQSLDSYIVHPEKIRRFYSISFLWESLKGRRILYVIAIFALLLEAMSTFLAPLVVRLTIDSVIGSEMPSLPAPFQSLAQKAFGPDWNGGGYLSAPLTPPAGDSYWVWRPWFQERLWVLALAFFAFIGLQALFSFTASWLFNLCAEDSAKRMRDRLYGHVQDLPWESLLRAKTGDWLQRCTSDVDTTRRFIASELPELARTLFLLAWAIPVMISLSPRLTLLGTLVFPPIIIFSFVFHRIVERVFRNADEKEGVLSSIIQENVTGVRVIRAFARQEYETARFEIANSDYRNQVFKLIRWLGFYWGFSSFLGILQIAIILVSSLFMITAGSLSIGLMVLFLTWEQQILWPVRQFGRILADSGKMRVAIERMKEILALKKEEDLDILSHTHQEGEKAKIESDSDLIRFENVSFAYPDGTEVLKDVSFSLERGEQLAIVGPTGSGKSTLAHLLLRLYEPQKGRILLKGCDIRCIPKRTLRRYIALVLQEGFIFGKSVRDNVRMARRTADEQMIAEAAKKADFLRVVDELTEGWNTMVGERGVTLSGGQRQRLALARALVREAPILVLDDSLSAVDTETDERIRRASLSQKAAKERGSIIIAHRITSLASADRILVLEEGRVSALGTHEELSKRPGLYRRLALLQEAIEQDSLEETAI